jgi:hypothetical protein
MTKEYKVSYKTYLNERLKKVDFHREETFPLYLQITFERKSIFFKSYYFELLAQPRYSSKRQGKKVNPTIADVIRLEEELIGFIIDRNRESFSLELFKEQYNYYCVDLCTVTNPDFCVYLDWFFKSRKQPALGAVLARYNEQYPLYEILDDMKQSLLPELYIQLIEQSFSYGHFGAPYILLSGFMLESKNPPLLIFTAKDWEDENTQAKFTIYLKRVYSDKDTETLKELVKKRVTVLRKQS